MRNKLIAIGLALAVRAQPVAPNATGISMSHVHLTVRDIDANQQFFTLLGGKAITNGSLQLMEFPGVYIALSQGEPTAGSVGSIVNHFGFHVRSIKDVLPKWQAAGLKVESMPRPTQLFLLSPDQVRVEIFEEPGLTHAIEGHHIHYAANDIPGIQAWYAKAFGAIPGKRATFEAADLPGINLSFNPSETALSPTKGRALDHIAFEVRDLKTFLSKFESSGGKIDRPYARIPGTNIASAFVADPWGTSIELNEGLAPNK